MNHAMTIINWALGLLGAFMVYDGCLIFTGTSGYVQGSEFGMLLTIANILSLVILWLGLFTLRFILVQHSAKS